MDSLQAINIAVGCVMASGLDVESKKDVIDTLRKIEITLDEQQPTSTTNTNQTEVL